MKEIQELSINQDVVQEKTRITITNPDDKEYRLVFKDPNFPDQNHASEPIKAKATAEEMKWAVWDSYWYMVRSGVDVELVYKDNKGLVTTDSTQAVEYVYTITLQRLIAGVSTSSIIFVAGES